MTARKMGGSLIAVLFAGHLAAADAGAGAPETWLRVGDRSISRPVLAARYGTPLQWSASGTLVVGRLSDWDRFPCARGWLIGAEIGRGGGAISLGATLPPHLVGFYPHGVLMLGLSAQATLLRTDGSPLAADPDATYLGPEIELGSLFFHVRLGWLRRLAGTPGRDDRWRAGVGIGF